MLCSLQREVDGLRQGYGRARGVGLHDAVDGPLDGHELMRVLTGHPSDASLRSGLRGRCADRPGVCRRLAGCQRDRSEEHTSELQSLMRISYAVLCLKKKIKKLHNNTIFDICENKKKFKQ